MLFNEIRVIETNLLLRGVDKSYYSIWYSLLDDALQSQDLDSKYLFIKVISRNLIGAFRGSSEFVDHPVLSYFYKLSTAAMKHGALEKDDAMFDFGVELQWRVAVFRKVLKSGGERNKRKEEITFRLLSFLFFFYVGRQKGSKRIYF